MTDAAAASFEPFVPPPSPGIYDLGEVTRLDVQIPCDGFELAGHLYLPPGAPEGGTHPAVVLDGPVPSIKELTVPAYAIPLTRNGYVTLTFDRRGFGGSGGPTPLNLNPPDNVRDIRNATTYLLGRDDVDPTRVAAVGICTGAGFMLQAGALDRRYRAVACIAGAYGVRRQMRDLMGHDGWVEAVRALADQRLADLQAGRPLTHQALAPSTAPAEAALIHIDEAYDFYTARQQQVAPGWRNELTYESMQNLAEFDAVPYAALVAPTPLLVVHGTVDPNTPPRYAREVYAAAAEPKEIVWIETTNHVQLYDLQPGVDQAIEAMVDWLGRHMVR